MWRNMVHSVFSISWSRYWMITECAVAARQHSMYDINLDSYCMRHMLPCFSLENPEQYMWWILIMVGNKEVLKSIVYTF